MGAFRIGLSDIERQIGPHGLCVRGGFAVAPEEAGDFPAAAPGRPAAAIVMIGGIGSSFWPAFTRWREADPARAAQSDPLDAWTRQTVGGAAAQLGCTPIYPFYSEKPWYPFQQWAKRADSVHASPINILIHPDYGLWHAYRAALVLAEVPGDLPARAQRASPCDTCEDKPCLSACPAGAYSPGAFDLVACTDHLAGPDSRACHALGCRARDACPVGAGYRYGTDQRRFHMAAFVGVGRLVRQTA